jgi:hypothetical protein
MGFAHLRPSIQISKSVRSSAGRSLDGLWLANSYELTANRFASG